MADSFGSLRAFVEAKLSQQKGKPPAPHHHKHVKLLGDFIEVSLQNQQVSLTEFARRLNVELDVAEAIVKGHVPESELDNTLLVDIAAALGHPVNTIRLLLGREITPSVEASMGSGKSNLPRSNRV